MSYEYQEKLHKEKEKEEQRLIREQMREEEKLQKENKKKLKIQKYRQVFNLYKSSFDSVKSRNCKSIITRRM